MLEGDYREKAKNEILFPGKIYEDFVEFLRCIYPDKLKKVTEKNAYQIIPLAHEYAVKKIEKRCVKVLIQTVRQNYTSDVMELYKHIKMSETYGLEDLKKVCIYLASEHKLGHFRTAQEEFQISDASHCMIIELALQRRELDSEDETFLSLDIEDHTSTHTSHIVSSKGFQYGTPTSAAPAFFPQPPCKVKFTLTGCIKEENNSAKDILRALRLSKRYSITKHDIQSKLIKKLKGIKPDKYKDDAEFKEEFSLLPEDIKLAFYQND